MTLLLNFFTTPISVAFIVFNQRFLFLNKTKIVIKKNDNKNSAKVDSDVNSRKIRDRATMC